MTSEPALALDKVTRSFGAGRGVFDLDLKVNRGELVALLGDNGAGKTTLIRTVAGRLRPDAGTIRVAGGDPATEVAARKALGIVPQQIALYPDLTVRENLEIFGRIAGLAATAARTRSAAALQWIDLESRADTVVRALSGGQQRRVNLAAGVLHEPAVLLLDEPTVGIDAEARERLHDLLRGLKGRGQAIVLSTHDFAEAALLADRVAILAGGRLQLVAGPAELITQFFGTNAEVDLTLAEPPRDAALRFLRGLGLWPGRDPVRWFGPLEGGLDKLPSLVATLVGAGAVPVASGVRVPDLGSVVRRVAGSEASSP